MALLLFERYPYDKVVIDVAGDDGPTGPDIVQLSGTVDTMDRKWPEYRRTDDRPMILRYVPDAGSPTFLEDMDAVVGMAMQHGHCAILIHEMGVLAQANRTPAHTRRLLMHNRHAHVTGIFCMPRPMTVDPLVIAQSDLIYTFELPNPADRRRVAEVAGWDVDDFDAGVHGLRPHGYLLFDANLPQPEDGQRDMRMLDMPPLPADVVASVKRWAAGRPAAPVLMADPTPERPDLPARS
jgi:hypothetical protein